VYACGVVYLGSVAEYAASFYHQFYRGCEGHKMSLIFESLQLISQCVMSEMKLLLCNNSSECLLVNQTTSFHILIQRWLVVFDLFFHGNRVPIQSLCARDWKISPASNPSTGNDKDTISCLLVLTECRSKQKF
jgi:hypothetical protein